MARKVKAFHGHRVVGYYEPTTSRTAIVAVRTTTGYLLYVIALDVDFNVDDDSQIIYTFDDIATRVDLDRQFMNLVRRTSEDRSTQA